MSSSPLSTAQLLSFYLQQILILYVLKLLTAWVIKLMSGIFSHWKILDRLDQFEHLLDCLLRENNCIVLKLHKILNRCLKRKLDVSVSDIASLGISNGYVEPLFVIAG